MSLQTFYNRLRRSYLVHRGRVYALATLLFFVCGSNPQLANAELSSHLPGRCRKALATQKLTSASYFLGNRLQKTHYRLRKCRTYARKKFIAAGAKAISEFRNKSASMLPAHITLTENELTELVAEKDADRAAQHFYLWTFRYRGNVHFSTRPILTVRFPDNASILLRLWIRNRTTGTVEKHLSNITITNAAPTASIQIPGNIEQGKLVSLQAQANDSSLADTRKGFVYHWQIGNRSTRIQEGVSSILLHRFKKAGSYPVALQVTDKDGASSFVQRSILVRSSNSDRSITAPVKDDSSAIETPFRPVPTPATEQNSPSRPGPSTSTPPAPLLARWENQMLSYGKIHCATLANQSGDSDQRLGTTYYDAEWIYYQIAEYTGDSSWIACARSAETVFRDGYVKEWDGRVPGYWNFTHGLLADFLATGDPQSKDALLQLSHFAAYAGDSTPLEWTSDAELSREVAYAIMSYLNAEKAGAPRRARLAQLYRQALGHLDQWFTSRSAPYVRPFMVALTAQALIEYDEWIGDPAILPTLQKALDEIWDRTWLATEKTFQYTDRNHSSGGTEPAYDLNLLIAPAFAWLYKETGDSSYREKADLIFEGGVQRAWLANGKQFNQNYRWAFQYLRWRRGLPD